MQTNDSLSGILVVDKPSGIPSFRLVSQLRRLTGVRKIGHAGTLDPFATGVMVLLIGRSYTRLSDTFLHHDKEYVAELCLGVATDTYDCDGEVVTRSDLRPTREEIETAITKFQGVSDQLPPAFSAKKVAGRKMYELARKGIEVERRPCRVEMAIDLLSHEDHSMTLRVRCSKGTYIRSLAHDLGRELGCGAHLSHLRRLRSGPFSLDNALEGTRLNQKEIDLRPYLLEEAPCGV